LLLGLLSDPRMMKYFQEDDRLGQHAETPLVLVQAITDWIDADHTEAGNLGDEDRRYQYLRDPYRAKNAPFDSVAELQLVYGINDALYELLKGNVTIYNDNPAIELATAPIERILYWGLPACMVPGAPPDALLRALPLVAERLMLMRQLGAMLPLTVTALESILQSANLMGNVIDHGALQRNFTDSTGTTWYTISAQGSMGNVTRRIRAVFQASEGQFYYARVE
ncbi:MAG TPA: hypothetical protein VFH51_10820, partial [Myxococcota bacterium]|nr:hypothetical protein [Myxococcota bacterium]